MARNLEGDLVRSLNTLFNAGATGGLTDARLIERFLDRRGEAAEAAFEALMLRHGPMVLDICRNNLRNPHDVEDAFQATFLVLACNARSVRKRDSLSSWLFGVARRVASRARSAAARRQVHERRVAEMATAEFGQVEGPKDFSALFEEVERLPAKYREPIILCYLQGMTYEAAAERLCCPLGTLSVRLKRAREQLRTRLSRRGIAEPAGSFCMGFTPSVAVPAALAASTVRTSVRWGLVMAVDGATSAAVLTLTQGVLWSMAFKKLSVVAITLTCVALGVGTGMYCIMPPAPTVEVRWAAQQRVESLPFEETVTLSGKVLTPEGKPAVGAKIAVVSQYRTTFGDGKPRATSAADGTFNLPVPRAELALHLGAGQSVHLLATAGGNGLAWRSAADFLPEKERGGGRASEPVLRLVGDDAPLHGVLKTTDGKPAAGVRIELNSIWTNDRGDLNPWLAAVGRGEGFGQATWDASLNRYLSGPGLSRFSTTTDADGGFRLAGIGRGRLVGLRVWGDSAACAHVLARTVPGEKVTVNGLSNAFVPAADGCFGPEIRMTLGPSRVIEGVVIDAESEQPVAGATVQSHKLAGSSVLAGNVLVAQSDDAGRFRLAGMPIGRDNLLLICPSRDRPYLPVVVEVDTHSSDGPAKLKVKARLGVWVEGQVTDAKTGRPLVAAIDVFCPTNNPSLAQYPGYSIILPGSIHRTDGTGRFRVPAIPGLAVIAARLDGKEMSLFGKTYTAQSGRSYHPLTEVWIDGLSEDEPRRSAFFNVAPSMLTTSNYHKIQAVNVPPGGKLVKCDLKVE